MPPGEPLIPRDDPLLALAILSGRADAAVHAVFLGYAVGHDEADGRKAGDALVAAGLARKTSRGYKLTDEGKARTHEEYERRMAAIDRHWDHVGRD
jgi:DNA-binding transcriptional regulator PaaX